ncbi:DUF6303 family protein [Streptomyces sp. t39]|uniref:DUF6303 family protein n=1 Tax=Streptomyces sp. t39 TaxID=1828156 RepID=UPI0011CE9B8B|nr:DUF6303 family protein [Streptomyces sp. t39]TXS49886.1 hypothetical protein EAO77_28710 [Streptomyces sp. t39]
MTAAGSLTAQLSASRVTGRWRLYVVLLGAPVWPTYDFDGPTVPTVQERSRALTALGYVFTDGPDWEWTEDVTPDDDPAAPVVLIAATSVREGSP